MQGKYNLPLFKSTNLNDEDETPHFQDTDKNDALKFLED